MSCERTLYDVLLCEQTASHEEIKKCYQSLVLEYHPDKRNCEESNADSSSRFIEIDDAWKVLRDVDRRNSYDAKLMQSAFNERPIIHATLKKSDFVYDTTQNRFWYGCRCGGQIDLPQDCDECFLACSDCSLVIELEL